MIQRIDIHDFDSRIVRSERLVEACNPISARNADLIRRFEYHGFSAGLSKARISKYVYTLRKIAEWLDKDFDAADRGDIERLVTQLERSDYSPWTKHDYKVAIKRFYKWLNGDEEYPSSVKWIKTTFKAKDELLPEDLLDEEEVMQLVNAADRPRDKAFIMTLYESGARIGELGTMRIRDVAFEERYTALMLTGKTGSRRVIVVAATPYLTTWIQHHPRRADPEAPLWVNLGTVNRYQAMSYPALAKVLRVATKRAKLTKRVTPHKLRHSRATFLASKLTEAQMNQVFGWKQGSNMPSIYVHLSGRDVDNAILGVYGLKTVEDEPPKLVPRVCPRCAVINAYDATFCTRCGLALDVKAAAQIDHARRQTDDVMDVLMRDDEFRQLLKRKLVEHGLTDE
jgi:site-specific recombinase XerD